MLHLSKEMLSTYRQRRALDFIILTKCLAKNRVEEFHRIGHQLSGNARSFGHDELEPIAKKMESLRPRELAHSGPAVLNEFRRWLDANKV